MFRNLVLILLLMGTAGRLSAQEKPDSLRFYKKLKKAAAKHKLTRMAYEATFRDPEPHDYPSEPSSKEEKQVNPYLQVQGAVIREIYIRVYDPFGYSVNDTTPKHIDIFQKAGNHLHLTTRKFIINNRLLFKKNEKIDPLKISESERLLREAVYVNDARIYFTKVPGADSVDIQVVVTDKWPVVFGGEVTDMNANAQFRNRNLFGSGNQFEQYGKVVRDLTYVFRGSYTISNIDNTYISSQLGYSRTPDETGVYLGFDKPFYSFLASWAGGAYASHYWRSWSYYDTINQVIKKIPLNQLNYDLWLAKTIKLSERKTLFNQSTNIIVGGRYFNGHFLKRPDHEKDTARTFVNAAALLGNVGFAVQQYYKDQYIYRFGANEDVPEGFIVQFTYGGLKREFDKVRYYNGIEVAKAKHFSFGYLAGTFSYGILYNVKVPNDVTTNYNIQYFSNLMKNGKWYFRQFLNVNLVHGENKLERQTITLRAEDLYGFQSQGLNGNTKLVLNSETVAYLPYSFIGFKFAPVAMIGLGVIGDPKNSIQKSRLYQGYSIGLMLRNENLLVNTYQFSVGLYPFLPNNETVTFVYNPVANFTLRLRGFSVGRPDFVSY